MFFRATILKNSNSKTPKYNNFFLFFPYLPHICYGNFVNLNKDSDAFWEVAPDYPDHLLKRAPPRTSKPPPSTSNKTNTKNNKPTDKYNTQQPQKLLAPHPHPPTTTRLHLKNTQSGKKVTERLKVPVVTNHPPVPTPPCEINNKNVITTNKFLSHKEKTNDNTKEHKEYQRSRYADNNSNR